VNGLADRPEGEIGFAFASPVLFLSEGTRNVSITLYFGAVPPKNQNNPAPHAEVDLAAELTERNRDNKTQSDPKPAVPPSIPLNIFFSGEEGWLVPEQVYMPVFGQNDQSVTINCIIGKGQKPVVAYNEEVLLQPFKTEWPVAKITLNTNSPRWAEFYTRLRSKTVSSAKIEVNVSEVRTIIVQSDDSVLATEKPFTPFGSRPVSGSTFYIGSREVFQKKLDSLVLNIGWHGLPDPAVYPQGFQSYYKNYLPASEAGKRTNLNFRVDAAVLVKKGWMSLNDPDNNNNYTLFTQSGAQPSATRRIVLDPDALKLIPRAPGMDEVSEFGSETIRGFMRLKLGPVDFGHGLYQNSFAQQAIWMVQSPPAGVTPGLPPEPYTPQIKEIYLDYSSSQSLDLTRHAAPVDATNYSTRVDQFFHVAPFGVAENHPHVVKSTVSIPALPQFADEGTLYIGLSNLQPPQVLTLLLKVAEGSENPDLQKQPVQWSYLSGNEWFSFTNLQLLGDTTNGLLTSGIVTLEVPKAITSANTIMPGGLSWLKATIAKESAAVCDMIDVQAQVVTATFADNGNDHERLRLPLPAGKVKSLVESDAAIDKVSQPYASFGGKVQEQSQDFYVRVSERLRHKHRAITIKDYELIVLEKFPAVFKVKCLNHTKYISLRDISELKPGHVSLVVIANLHNRNAVDPLKPKASQVTLTGIRDYIRALNPPCVDLHVKNPIFEEITVSFKVKFHAGFDIGFYGKKLNEEIRRFLAPWAYGPQDVIFGGRIHKSMILNFVEDRPYVDFVTCFTMDQIIPGLPYEAPLVLKNVDEAISTTSASILTSAPGHTVEVMETEDCGCSDNDVLRPTLSIPEQFDCNTKIARPEHGIGANKVKSTFIVGHSPQQGVDFWVIEKDFEVQ
jgi:hypothetical protein